MVIVSLSKSVLSVFIHVWQGGVWRILGLRAVTVMTRQSLSSFGMDLLLCHTPNVFGFKDLYAF